MSAHEEARTALAAIRDDIARAIALTEDLVDPPLSGRYGRYADAAVAVLSAAPVMFEKEDGSIPWEFFARHAGWTPPDGALVEAYPEPTETEWEYRVAGDYYIYPSRDALREHFKRPGVVIERARKRGPWEPVPEGTTE